MGLTKNYLDNFLENSCRLYPDYNIIEYKEYFIILGETYFKSKYFEEYIEYKISLKIYKDFPNRLPKLKEIGGKIKDHLHLDSTACLGTDLELRDFLNRFPSFEEFFEQKIIGYLISMFYYYKYGSYVNGECEHGIRGVQDSYIEYKMFSSYSDIVNFWIKLDRKLYNRKNKKIKGMWCPCGSGRKFKFCHGSFKFYSIENFKVDINFFKKELSLILEKKLPDYVRDEFKKIFDSFSFNKKNSS